LNVDGLRAEEFVGKRLRAEEAAELTVKMTGIIAGIQRAGENPAGL